MIKTMNGDLFASMLDSGIRNLALHGKEVNDLNVFPVPDGDTGTNMTLTLRNGYAALSENVGRALPEICNSFSTAVLYGARGNSGVIVSRFFKGFCDSLSKADEADAAHFADALCCGTDEAYKAVSHPTEGTMLTVLREAGLAARKIAADGESGIGEIVKAYLSEARESLSRTPNLLPVLKNAGVVDSGGAGVVYFFEGLYKYLKGETVGAIIPNIDENEAIDFSKFNENSSFEYGYCTEFLLQLTSGKASDFDYGSFLSFLNENGESVVSTFTEGKVKVHVHTNTPEVIMTEAHRFGEFLALKIENMSVQHNNRGTEGEPADTEEETLGETAKICLPDTKREGNIGVIACAPDNKTVRLFHSMGVDSVILCPAGTAPTTKDFLDAVNAIGAESAIVFANNKNYVLSAMKASEILEGQKTLRVVRSGSIAECYAALALLDFEANIDDIVSDAVDTIANLYTVTVMQAVKDAVCDGVEIKRGDYIAMDEKRVTFADEELWELIKRVMNGYVEAEDREPDTVTVFTGKNTPEGIADMVAKRVERKYQFTEADVVNTDSDVYELIISFE